MKLESIKNLAIQDAADLREAYRALARIGRRHGQLVPIAGTFDRALIESFAGLQEIRRHLHMRAVAAGLVSPFVLATPTPPGQRVLGAAKSSTGDDDRPASLQAGPNKWPSAAVASAGNDEAESRAHEQAATETAPDAR